MHKFSKALLFVSLFSGVMLSNTASAALDDETIKKIDTSVEQYCKSSDMYENIYNFFKEITVRTKVKDVVSSHNAIEKLLSDSRIKAQDLYAEGYIDNNEMRYYDVATSLQKMFRNAQPAFIDRENKNEVLRPREFSLDYLHKACIKDLSIKARKSFLKSQKTGKLDDIGFDINNPTAKTQLDADTDKQIVDYIQFVKKYLWGEKK